MCLGCLYLVTLEVWKCGSVEIWKSGNVSWLSLSNNSGNVEMSLGCLYVVTLEEWKCVLVVFIYA